VSNANNTVQKNSLGYMVLTPISEVSEAKNTEKDRGMMGMGNLSMMNKSMLKK